MSEFTEHREAVINFIREGIERQGGTKVKAINATSCIYFWGSNEVEDLYKCINSELPDHVIEAIVAHDFNGLSRGDKGFLPKSYQFRKDSYALPR